MTIKDYLQQAYRLDMRINSHIKELEDLKLMAAGISSPKLTADKVQTSQNGDAPYVSALAKIWEMEEKVRLLPKRHGVSVRTALVYEGNLAPIVEAGGYFDAIIPFRRLLGA